MFEQLTQIDPTPSDYQTSRPQAQLMPLRDVIVAGLWTGALLALAAMVAGLI